jgi:hypothetical protein
MKSRLALYASLAVVASSPALATGEIESLITQADRERLANARPGAEGSA